MAFCSNCGSEVDPGSAFCKLCGNPLQGPQAVAEVPTQPSAPSPRAGPVIPPAAGPGPAYNPPLATGPPAYGPPAATMPQGAYPPPSRGKGGKIALFTILGLVLIAAVVVILLGFAVGPKWFVSSSDNPGKTVDTLLKAMENKDAKAFLNTISPASKKQLEDSMGGYAGTLETVVNNYIFIYQSMKFDGVKYKTELNGDKATITVAEGTVTIVDENGDKTSEEAKDSSEPTQFFLVKESGTWYIIFDQTFQ